MRHAPGQSGGLLSRACLVALAFWLGGAGCASFCSTVEASAAAASGFEHDPRAVRAASAPASCHAQAPPVSEAPGEYGLAAASASRRSPSGGRAGACCADEPPASDAARKPRTATERAEACLPRVTSRAEAAATFAARALSRSRSPDRHATYLRCRVLLI